MTQYQIMYRAKNSWYEDGTQELIASGGKYEDDPYKAMVELTARQIDDPEAGGLGSWRIESDDPDDYDQYERFVGGDQVDLDLGDVEDYLVDELDWNRAEAAQALL